MPPIKLKLKSYRKELHEQNILIHCPRCPQVISPHNYERHCTSYHSFNATLGCVWCQKKFWKKNEKHLHVAHLMICFNFFIKAQRSSLQQDSTSSNLKMLNLEHPYPANTFFEFQYLAARAHEPIWPLPIDPSLLLFQDDDLNLAAAYVQKYLTLRYHYDWFHAIVPSEMFDIFVDALNADQGISRTLLFSCWCKADAETQMIHRHFIVVSPQEHYKHHIWPKVTLPYLDRILSPFQLVTLLGKLSTRNMICEAPTDIEGKNLVQMHPFYFYRTLPDEFQLPLVLFWKRGLKELLYDTYFKYAPPSIHSFHLIQGQWKQKLKDISGYARDFVLPVSKGFMASLEPTPCFLHLLNENKLYFKFCPKNIELDHQTWLQQQAAGGNCFYNVVENAIYTPNPTYQAFLFAFMPTVERNTKLELEKAELKRKMCKRCKDKDIVSD